uniref:Uncharacterized protein ycf23 n=1 Tax=Paulinella longichromatophora TaxID=1708747 RepID=A0A2H4ZPG4_9EUKA|nr:hypothetical protein PLO_437 [Paulinella longichromatophora]
MSRLLTLSTEVQQSLQTRQLLKVISGLTNFDTDSVKKISRAAGSGGADLIDIACSPDLVTLAKTVSGCSICVSAVQPELFVEAVNSGATVIEIGNFDAFYSQGRIFRPAEVLELTRRARKLLPNVVLSVTVPHILPLDQQEQLAIDLVLAGADLIQTEGGITAKPISPGVLGLIEKAAPSLSAAYSISSAVNVPVLCSSGLSSITTPMAIAVGASGIGVGSAINRLQDELSMVCVVRSLRNALLSLSIRVN